MRASEVHRRYRTGGLPALKGVVYRVGFELGLRFTLRWQFGGQRLPARSSQVYYIGQEKCDWVAIGAACDGARDLVARMIAVDFGGRARLSRSLYIVLVAEDLGLATVSRRLELHRRYALGDACRMFYYWFERALFLSGATGTVPWQSDLLYGLCLARLHEIFGSTWYLDWATSGYAHAIAHLGLGQHSDAVAAALRHLAEARARGTAMRLADLVSHDAPAEDFFGPLAYHELCLLFVQYLRTLSGRRRSVGAFLREQLRVRSQGQVGDSLRALEEAFSESVEKIEAAFFEWCQTGGHADVA